MSKKQQTKGAVTAGFKAKPNLGQLRSKMKYRVSTTSTTASGVVAIKGATNYPDEPAIYFTREAWVKQCHLVRKCDKEVGWFALVDHDETDNSFTITEIVIPNQEVTAAETDIGKEDLADAAMELIEAGKDTSKMYAWFHSHVNMGVSPSAQDEYQVEDFLEDLADQPEVPAFIRGIQNKKGDLKIDVYYVQHGVAYQNVEFYVIHDDDPQWLVDIESEIKSKVNDRVYPTYNNQYYNRGTGGYHQQKGKSQAGGGNHQQGYGGYNSFDDYWDAYDYEIYEEEEEKAPVSDADREYFGLSDRMDSNDQPEAPMPVVVGLKEYDDLAFEVIYSGNSNTEVLLDNKNNLWVCDENGDMFHYDEYTAVYGDIDAATAFATVAT